MVGRSPGVGRGSCDSAVRYQITDTRPLFQRSLSRLLSLTALEAPLVFSIWLASAGCWQCHPLRICQSVCCCDWHSFSLSENSRKGGKWFCYQLVAAGQHNTERAAAAATDSSTPHLPAVPVLCFYVSTVQRQWHWILRMPSCCPPSGVNYP